MSYMSDRPKVLEVAYPNVDLINISISFKDPDSIIPPLKKELNKALDHPAWFKVECHATNCVGGGYDLEKVINDMVRDQQTNITDKLICQGKQSEFRKNKCWCELDYSIQIHYKSV